MEGEAVIGDVSFLGDDVSRGDVEGVAVAGLPVPGNRVVGADVGRTRLEGIDVEG